MRATKFFAKQGWDIENKMRVEKGNQTIRRTREGIYSFYEDEKRLFCGWSLREFAIKYAVHFNVEVKDDSISMLSYFKKVGFKQISTTRHSFALLGIYVQKRGSLYFVRDIQSKKGISEGMRKNDLKQYLKDNYNILEEK